MAKNFIRPIIILVCVLSGIVIFGVRLRQDSFIHEMPIEEVAELSERMVEPLNQEDQTICSVGTRYLIRINAPVAVVGGVFGGIIGALI